MSMNPKEIIDRITAERIRRIRLFPSDMYLIEDQVKLAVAGGMEEALKSVEKKSEEIYRRGVDS